MKHPIRSSLLLVALLGAGPLSAQDVPAAPASAASSAELLPTVEVTVMRDPQFIPYAAFHASVEKFYKLPERDRLQLVLRVVPKRDDIDLRRLRARLEGDGYRRELPVSVGGRLEVPHDPQALASDAAFAFNVKNGSLQPEINVLVRLDGLTHRYADLMKALQQADNAERALMSMTQRLLFPRSNALALGFGAGSSASLQIEGLRSGPLTLTPNARGVIGLPQNEEWLADNPLVQISQAPDWTIAAIAPKRGRNNP